MRTGFLDKLAQNTGLEFVGWVLKPGEWVKTTSTELWEHYIHLVDVKEENQRLQEQLERMNLELAKYREEASEVRRLRELVALPPPQGWEAQGARVIAQRLGPNAILETVMVDRGALSRAVANTPAITHQGVAGRVLHSSLNTSSLLLVSDPNSRVAIVGQTHRSTGILAGMGPDQPCRVLYVPYNDPMEQGEILVTSGLAEIFPKGLPVARVTQVTSDTSLFLTIEAELLVDLRNLEEVLLLMRLPSELMVRDGQERNATAGAGEELGDIPASEEQPEERSDSETPPTPE
ncbi:MAG: rod shape-determining protein MreC [Desulfovibrio sp.]|nr:MAG: rod shape-determining protein MreC [Desulfovibrio sp.]